MLSMIVNDLKNYYKYRYLTIFLIVSVLFGFLMGLTHIFPPIIYVYISVFILPVISFSINLVIGFQQEHMNRITLDKYVISKLISAMILQLIPMIIYLIVYLFVLNVHFNILFFIVIYLVSSLVHIMIGLSLSIIAKTNFSLSLSYLVYLVVFSIIPIFYSLRMIDGQFVSYILIISPAYLAGVMFEALIDAFHVVDSWFVYVAFIIQLVYIAILYLYVIKPFVGVYLSDQKKQFE